MGRLHTSSIYALGELICDIDRNKRETIQRVIKYSFVRMYLKPTRSWSIRRALQKINRALLYEFAYAASIRDVTLLQVPGEDSR